jgi:acyl carrier protein
VRIDGTPLGSPVFAGFFGQRKEIVSFRVSSPPRSHYLGARQGRSTTHSVRLLPRFRGDTSMPSRDEIFEKVKTALVDALGVDDDEVSPTATMVGDLGAESIDFLDIVFRLEKAFGIKIPRGELFPEDVLSSTEYVTNGKVNAAGIAALKARMPFADLAKFEANPSVQNFANTLTVEDMVRYVQGKLAV